MPLKLLAAADLHLGRRPSRLPEVLTEVHSARDLGPAAAWERLVTTALEEEVHALLLAGDLVEGEHDFFEALRELEGGVNRLLEAGVRVLAVAGNHDTRVLPYLADRLEGFELLGRTGWERTVLEGEGEEATVWGWSFPRARVREDPVAGERFSRGPGPNLGLLHGDRDRAGSSYAPVRSRSLEVSGLDGWLLGHIHRPDPLSAPRPVGYLGSLTGLDPGEQGVRGAWRLTVEGGEVTAVERRTLTPLRWEGLALDVEGLEEPEGVRNLLLDALGELTERAALEAAVPPLAIGVRLTLTGRSPFRRRLEALLEEEALDRVTIGGEPPHVFVESHRVDTLPTVELGTLARRADPVGLLARRLLLLERPAEVPERRELVERARRALERTAREDPWRALRLDPPDEEETAVWLGRAGREALDRLLAARETG